MSTAAIPHILWPTDFSQHSLLALPAARALAQRSGGTLHVVHVTPLLIPDATAALETAGDLLSAPTDLQAECLTELRTFVSRHLGEHSAVKSELRVGNPADEIGRYAGEHAIDMIVLPTHGRTGLAHVLLGSVAEKVVRHAPCPVLIVRQRSASPSRPGGPAAGAAAAVFAPTRILWPTDFSPLSMEAGRRSAGLCRLFAAELHALHVCEPITAVSGAPALTEPTFAVAPSEQVNAAAPRLKRAVEEIVSAGAAVKQEVRMGVPWREVCDHAAAAAIDLIVVSTHGRTGLMHVLMGSTAERIVQHAPCDVLVVKSAANPN